jgi:hypothetical protein
VAYVNNPATASDTSVDNPTACGIIAVNGTSGGAPLDSAIRTAITADGGTGSTAYYVVIANVSVPANTTTITSGLISAGKSINLSNVATTGSNGLMSGADKTKLNGIDKTKLDGLLNYSTTEEVVGTWINGKPLYRRVINIASPQTSNADYDIVANNMDKCVRIYGYAYSSDYGTHPIPQTDSASSFSVVFIKNDNKTLRGRFSLGGNPPNNVYVVVEYTKTTD